MAVSDRLGGVGEVRTEKGRTLVRRRVRGARAQLGLLLKSVALRVRSRHLFMVDTIGMVAAGLLALGIMENALPTAELVGQYLWVLGITVAARVVVDIQLGLYRHSWRFASVRDMFRIVVCVVAGSALAIVIVNGAHRFADSDAVSAPPMLAFWEAEMFISFVVLAGTRFAIRAASEISSTSGQKPMKRTPHAPLRRGLGRRPHRPQRHARAGRWHRARRLPG